MRWLLVDGTEFDLDWFTTILQHTVIDPTGRFGKTTPALLQNLELYGGGKWLWYFRRRNNNIPIGNAIPFQDPGERNALKEIMNGTRYKDLFSGEFLKKYCP